MARMFLSFGACPLCGDHVPRTIQTALGLEREIFHCPVDGRLPYGEHGLMASPMILLESNGEEAVARYVDPMVGLGIEVIA